MFRIVYKKSLNETTEYMSVLAPAIAAKALPGQFIIFRTDEKSERIPLTIADYDREKGTVTVIFQKVGKATMKLGAMKEGDEILDFVGPLGRPSELDEGDRVAVIGGGLGCAIAYPQAKYLKSRGAKVDMIAGFRTKDLIILEDEMKKASDRLVIKTDDASNGNGGLVTDALREEERGVVRVSSVHPGRVDTDMQVQIMGEDGYDGSKYVHVDSIAAAVRLCVDATDDCIVEEVTVRPRK